MRHLVRGFALTVGLGGALLAPGRVQAQGVGFAQGIGTIPDGVQMNVVPVVSADRRYVRLSLGVGFQTIDGFQNFPVPGAVAGGGNGGGTFGGGGGGFGGTGVGGGVAGGGFRSVMTGMDGTISPGMGQSGYSTYPSAAYGYGYAYDNYGMGYDPMLDQVAPKARRARTSRSRVSKAKPAATETTKKAPAKG